VSRLVAPLLVFGWGNPSRGDDALGPLLVEQLAGWAQKSSGRMECLTDFQLQVEHALDLVGRERVLFVDAALGLQTPFEVSPPTRWRPKRCCRSTATWSAPSRRPARCSPSARSALNWARHPVNQRWPIWRRHWPGLCRGPG